MLDIVTTMRVLASSSAVTGLFVTVSGTSTSGLDTDLMSAAIPRVDIAGPAQFARLLRGVSPAGPQQLEHIIPPVATSAAIDLATTAALSTRAQHALAQRQQLLKRDAPSNSLCPWTWIRRLCVAGKMRRWMDHCHQETSDSWAYRQCAKSQKCPLGEFLRRAQLQQSTRHAALFATALSVHPPPARARRGATASVELGSQQSCGMLSCQRNEVQSS